jgi:hypothetical protein
VPLFGSTAHDHVITSLFPPLYAGEHLRLLESVKGGHLLTDALFRKHNNDSTRYSYLKATPSHMRMLSVDERAAVGKDDKHGRCWRANVYTWK